MKYMFPCLLSCSGIPNNKIISASVSVQRNNVVRRAELDVMGVSSPPASINITYNGVDIFSGGLVEVRRRPCGRAGLVYETRPSPITGNLTTLMLSLNYFVREYSSSVGKRINQTIEQRSMSAGPIKPIKDDEPLLPGTLAFVHPFASNLRWMVTLVYFVGNKSALVQKAKWQPYDPEIGNIIGFENVLAQIFGGFTDAQVVLGPFVVIKESVNSGADWYTVGWLWLPKGINGIGKVVADPRIAFITENPGFVLESRTLDSVGDVLVYFGYPPAGQTQKIMDAVRLEPYASLTDLVRRYCKNIALSATGSGEIRLINTTQISRSYSLPPSAIFDMSLPDKRYINVVVEQDYNPPETVMSRKKTVGYSFPNAIDTVVLKVADTEIADTQGLMHIVTQTLQDNQITGSIRTVLLPHLEPYERIVVGGRTYLVVAFRHTVEAGGAYTDIQIIPEVP